MFLVSLKDTYMVDLSICHVRVRPKNTHRFFFLWSEPESATRLYFFWLQPDLISVQFRLDKNLFFCTSYGLGWIFLDFKSKEFGMCHAQFL